MTVQVGQTVGRYHVLEQLGEGGMATVYKAFDTRLEREVAIKVILSSKQQTQEIIRRFEREAKSLAKLSHANIIKVLDYGDHDGSPYLVMEFSPVGTLKEKLGAPMPWQEAAKLLMPIAKALKYAHEQKIIHRDVKPSNILITESGDPMLSDFGIAKVLEADKSWDLTGTGVGIGTPKYMAPEQGMGKKIDHRVDIYALGIVLFEMLTGRTPFRADTPLAVLIKQINAPLPRPRDLVGSIPEQVEQVIIKALAKSPQDRFENMGAFIEALKKLAIEPAPKIDKPRQIPVRKIPRLAVIAGAAGLLLISALVVVWVIGSGTQPAERTSPSPEPESELPAATDSPTLTPESALTLTVYDDFDSYAVINPMRWQDDSEIQVENGIAVYRAQIGERESSAGDLAAHNLWLPRSSGEVRIAIETDMRLGPSVLQTALEGDIHMQLVGPENPPARVWYFALGYYFKSGFLAYKCAVAEYPGPYIYNHVFGTPAVDEWHTFRISIQETSDPSDLVYVAYVDGEQVCRFVPPREWQEDVQGGKTLALFLFNAWKGAREKYTA